jgi:autotransporter-associated beta strand protein
MSAVRVLKNQKLVRGLGLMASASIMSLMLAGEAQASCVVNPNQPLNAITTDSTTVLCTGSVNAPVITANANGVLVDVNGPSTFVSGGTITVSGNNGAVAIRNNGSLNGAIINLTGSGNTMLWGFGAVTNNLRVNVNGADSQLVFDGGSQVTQSPGDITVSSAAGQSNAITISAGGGLFATGSNGQYMINGGTGNQNVTISGLLVAATDGFGIALGDGDDSINIAGSANISAQGGGAVLFNGGTGNDTFSLNFDGTWQHNTVGFEIINLNPTNALTLTGSNADAVQFNVQGGSVTVNSGAALGVANSTVDIGQFGELTLAYTASASFNNTLTGSGRLNVDSSGNTITFGGNGNGYSGAITVTAGTTAVVGAVNAVGTGDITNNGTVSFGDMNLTNNVSGTGRTIYTGIGTGDLSGNNTFSGGIDIRSGSLRVDNVNALGTGAVTSTTGGVILQIDNSGAQTLANDITGDLVLAKTDTGVLTLTGTNTYTGGTLIDAGGVRVDSFARLGTGQVIANANGSLILNYNGAGQLLQTTPFMTGAGSFIKEGTGDVVMTQTSTYTGGTIIRAGRIGLNNGDALGTGAIQVDAGAELGIGGIVLNNNLTGTGLVRKTASNLVELYADNRGFTGTIQVADGLLFAVNGNALGAGTLQIDSGTNVQLGAVNDSTVAANFAGGGSFEKLGGGLVTLTGNGSLFTGSIGISDGVLEIAGSQNIGNVAGVFINAAGTLQLNTAGSTQFFNSVAGDGRVIKTGTGTVFLTGLNSYTGGTDIQQGAIRVTDASFLGTGAITVQAGAALDLSIAMAQTLSQNVTGAGILRKSDVGDLTLLNNGLTGGVGIVGGRVIVSTAAALGGGPVTTAADTQLVFNNSTTEGISNVISGAGTLRKTGTGLLAVNNANSYTGGTLVDAGRLVANDSLAFGTGGVIILSGAEVGIGGVTLANNISGAGRVVKTANNTGSLTGNNSYSGGTDIQQGVLVVTNPAALGSGAVSIASGAFLNVNYSGSVNAALNNVITGAGAFIKDGSGTVVMNTAGNTYSGGTAINGGRLTLNFGDALGTSGVVINAGAELGIGGIALANNISGVGRIVKTSSGTATLTGTNTYSGGTDIQGGSILVSNTAALSTGGVTTATGTQLIFDITGNQGSNVAISGAGGVTKQGTGLLAINNVNSYTGGTAINAGRLVANTTGAFGTGAVSIAQGAELGLGGVTVANTLTGVGRVIKTANNVGGLTGINTYSGGTDIQGGTLVVNSPAALGTGSVSMATATALNVNYTGSANAALNNLLTGAGSLIKDGSGTVIMNTAGNSYSGGTTINAGRLGLNFGDALGTGAVAVAAGAQLAIGDISFGNAVSGAGQIVKTSSGAASLTGTNTHGGGVDIQGGSLAVAGNGALGTGTVSIATGASLNYTNTAASTFSNGLSGAGTFNKLGAGQLTFANNFALGALSLQAGRTRMNVVGTTNVTVGSAATLDGTGRIVGNLTNNGVVAPGNSIGTLTVQGNYTHNSGSVLEVEFDAAGNIDLLDVTGNATLNGGIIRFVSIGGAEGQGGTFLRTGGTVNGTFAAVETVGALLPLSVIYETNRAFMAPSVLTARPSTFNAQSMAVADTTLGFIDSMGVADVRHAQGNRVWMNGFGAWGKRSASGTTLGYNHDSRGLSGGVNFDASDALTLGLAVGWAKADIKLASNGGGGDQSSVLGSINARYTGTGFTLGGGVLFGKVDQDTLRNVSFNGFSASVNGSTDSKVFGAFAELGLPLGSTGDWAFSANARGSYIRQKQDGYTESGNSPLRLKLGDLKTSTMEGQAKLTAKTLLWDGNQGGEDVPNGLDLRIEAGARYLGTLGDRLIPVTFAASTAGITLQGDTRNTLQGQLGLGLDYTTRSGATFSLGYKGEVGKTDRHSVQAGVSFAF